MFAPDLLATARRAQRVTIFSGAGMSAESGLATFRDKDTGLWSQVDPQALASVDAWRRDPEPQWAWYLWRAYLAASAHPNAGHEAVARWGTLPGVQVTVVTQNIDSLHERAGSGEVIHLHGELTAFRCAQCSAPAEVAEIPDTPVERATPPRCDLCGGTIRPGVVWFGEPLPQREWAAAESACLNADLLVVVGTSGVVYPAASLPLLAAKVGVATLEVSPEQTALSPAMRWSVWTTAATGLPALVAACTDAH